MGRELSLQFAKEWATVVAVARRKERLEEITKIALDEKYARKIVPYVGDLSKEETNNEMIDYTFKNFGTLDILINNAGVLDNFAPVAEVTSVVNNIESEAFGSGEYAVDLFDGITHEEFDEIDYSIFDTI